MPQKSGLHAHLGAVLPAATEVLVADDPPGDLEVGDSVDHLDPLLREIVGDAVPQLVHEGRPEDLVGVEMALERHEARDRPHAHAEGRRGPVTLRHLELDLHVIDEVLRALPGHGRSRQKGHRDQDGQ